MWHDVAADDALPEGHALAVTVDGEPVMLVRVTGKVFATNGLCTHEDKPLAEGFKAGRGCEWECRHHGARFDLETGRATQMPAVAPLETHPVRVEAGRVLVDL